MSINEYAKEVVTELEKLRSDLTFSVNEVKKNNGLELTAITIAKEDHRIAPTIYINSFYENETSVEETADAILSLYKDSENPAFDIDLDNIFSNFDTVKDKIIARLINKEKNQFILDDVPYAQFGDMIVVFVILIHNNINGVATTRITNHMMNMWKINLAQLIEIAYANTKVIAPMEIGTMYEILEKMIIGRHDLTEEQKKEILSIHSDDINMFVVSNKHKQNGSYFITDRESLIEISKVVKDNQFYILPSSIHEFIVIPKNDSVNMDEENMLKMVKEVNDTQVPYDEILSDNVYVFDADIEELRTVTGTVIPFIA